MKKIIFITLLVFSFCTLSAQSQNIQKDVQCNDLALSENVQHVIEISQSEFIKKIYNYNNEDAVYKGNLPVIVDFYASWCGPCKMLAPIMDELSSEYSGRVIFYKVNVDKAEELSQAMGIEAIPTMLFIKPNTSGEELVGFVEKSYLVEIINTYLLGDDDSFEY